MDQHIVETKRKPGRPLLEGGTPEQQAKRRVWREKARERYYSGHVSDTNSIAGIEARRKALIEYKGGKCAITGEREDLHFHHVVPSTKSFDVTTHDDLGKCSWKTRTAEADKCVLITRREHYRIHNRVKAKIRAIEKHTLLTREGKRGLVDYYTKHYTEQAIAIGQIKQALNKIED